MNVGDTVTIQFKGKDVECKCIQPGVVQKTASIFYIQDCVSKEWLYCFPERLANLNAKNDGDLSEFKGRQTRADERDTEDVAKAGRKAEREAAKAEKEATAQAEADAKADADEQDDDELGDAFDETVAEELTEEDAVVA